MRKAWWTPRVIMTNAVVDLSVAAVLLVVSIVLLTSGNRGGIITCVFSGIALIGGFFALYAYQAAQRAAAEGDAEEGSRTSA